MNRSWGWCRRSQRRKRRDGTFRSGSGGSVRAWWWCGDRESFHNRHNHWDWTNFFDLFNSLVQVHNVLHSELVIFNNFPEEAILACIDGVLMCQTRLLCKQCLKLEAYLGQAELVIKVLVLDRVLFLR